MMHETRAKGLRRLWQVLCGMVGHRFTERCDVTSEAAPVNPIYQRVTCSECRLTREWWEPGGEEYRGVEYMPGREAELSEILRSRRSR